MKPTLEVFFPRDWRFEQVRAWQIERYDVLCCVRWHRVTVTDNHWTIQYL